MSVSSSAPSTYTSPSSWGLNDRLVSLMESIYSIIAGLGLRYVVDTVSRHDFKIAGTLVGLWEGVILLHFLKKLPKSTDPYLAFAVRLFIDFVVTESISRLVLVLTWTGMGMILADVAPAIWEDTGLRRVWRRFRRDLYIISESVPTVVFFPPTRTVRFSPSREPSVIAEVEGEEEPDADTHTEARSPDSSTSAGLTDRDTSANVEPTSIRRRLPGYFPGMLSDTESALSSVVSRDIPLPSTFQRDSERTSRRLSVYPIADLDFASETSSQRNEDDDIKLSSSASSQSTVTGPGDTTRFTDDIRDFDTTQITDIPDEEVLEEQIPAEAKEKAEEIAKKDQYPEETGPKQTITLFLPPTPSDSQPPHRRRLPKVDQLRPSSASIPQIPDLPEDLPSDGPSDGWEKIQREDATDTEPPWEQVQREDAIDAEKPPPPPPKDLDDMNRMERLLSTTSTNANDHVGLGETTNTDEYRYSQPPPYFDHADDHDDIYEDHPSDRKVPGAVAGDPSNANTSGGGQQVDGTWINKQAEAEEKRLKQEEAEKKRQEEAAEQRRKDEEAEMTRMEKEAVEKLRKDEEKRLEELERKLKEEAAERQRKDEEKRLEELERKLKEEAAERQRKDEEKRLEELERKLKEEAAERQRKDEEKRLEELERKRKEEVAERERQVEEKRLEELEMKRKEEAERQRKDEEERLEELERKRKEEVAEIQRKVEEMRLEELEIRKEEAAEQRRKDEEAEMMRMEEEAAEKRRKDEEMRLEELEMIRQEEAAEQRRKDEEAEMTRMEEEAAEKQRKDEEKRLEELEMKRIEEAERQRKDEENRLDELEREAAERERKVEEKRLEEQEAERAAEKQREDEEKKLDSEMERKLEEDDKKLKEKAEKPMEEAEKLDTTLEEAKPYGEEERVDHEAETQHSRQVPTPSTSALEETQGVDAQPSSETVKEEAQANEEGNDEPDDGEQHRMETESVATEQSTRPADVESRLSRILLTKAQIVEIQSRINELGAQLDADEGTPHDLQKVLEKLKRKERRLRDEVIPLRMEPGLNDTADHISFDALGQDDSKTRLLEKLDELLSPEATSLYLTIECGAKRFKNQQKQAVTEVLTKFGLLRQTTPKGRQTVIEVPPENFSEWVTRYRANVTQPDDNMYL